MVIVDHRYHHPYGQGAGEDASARRAVLRYPPFDHHNSQTTGRNKQERSD